MTTGQLEDVWATRDFPVLREVTRRFDEGEDLVSLDVVAEATRLTEEQVERAARALERRGLVELHSSLAGIMGFKDVAAEAYLLTGLHPNGDTAVSQLISALQQAADQTADPDEKSRLRKLADTAADTAGDVLANVLTTVITAAGRGVIN